MLYFHPKSYKTLKHTHHGSSIVCRCDGSKSFLTCCVPKIWNKGVSGFKGYHQHHWGENLSGGENSGRLTKAVVSRARGKRCKGNLLCVCELEAEVATGACQELTMTLVGNLDLDDKSSNKKMHGPARNWHVLWVKHMWERIVWNSWTPASSYNPFYKCLMIKAFCSLDWKSDFCTKQAIGLDLLLCEFCSAEHTKMDLKNFVSYRAWD